MKLLKLSLLCGALSFSSLSIAEVAVIVNPSNSASLSESDISRLFLGKLKTFENGEKVKLVNLKFGNATRNEFETNVLKKSSSQVKAYWSKLMFSGKGKPPKEFGTDKDILAFVADNAGAIAYVDSASVDASVKVIKTF
jgi:ABC-type phosphate transport system substrate-binding protein